MRIIFIADTHLNKKKRREVKSVETFVRDVCRTADMVFILGDLFEFYHGYQGYIYPWFKGVADAFKSITEEGTSVYFMEGNHEFDMGAFFESYTGIRCVKNLTIDIEGKRTFISHGDEFHNACLTRLLKTPFTYGVMNMFGPELSWKIAMGLSLFLSKKKKGQSEQVMHRFRDHARQKFDEGYDAVILAHSHMSDKVEYGAGEDKKVYLNTGDFIRFSTYVEYTSEGGFEIKNFNTDLQSKIKVQVKVEGM
jgi:UDP-2,3-diacylglucosamine hydrolase